MIETMKNMFNDFYSNWYYVTLIEYYLYLAICLNQTRALWEM